jgi:hypothetical protein
MDGRILNENDSDLSVSIFLSVLTAWFRWQSQAVVGPSEVGPEQGVIGQPLASLGSILLN